MGGLINLLELKNPKGMTSLKVYPQVTFMYHFSINLVRLFQHAADLWNNRVQSIAFFDAQKDVS